jgi:hypothetical protein
VLLLQKHLKHFEYLQQIHSLFYQILILFIRHSIIHDKVYFEILTYYVKGFIFLKHITKILTSEDH